MTKIFLVGAPAAGKTSIGKSLSISMQLQFLDSDQLIEAQLQQTIVDIFASLGEESFRSHEQALLEKITLSNNIVLATGGGSILSAATRTHLKARGTVCYLKVSPQQQMQRLLADITRPLLPPAAQRLAFFTQMYAERHYLYESIADIIIDTNNRSIDDLSNQLAYEVFCTHV